MFDQSVRESSPLSSYNFLYLVLLLLVPRHVVIHVGAGPLDGQDSVPDGRDHVQLLDDRVHVAGGAGVLQTDEALVGPRSHWGQVLPLSERLAA